MFDKLKKSLVLILLCTFLSIVGSTSIISYAAEPAIPEGEIYIEESEDIPDSEYSGCHELPLDINKVILPSATKKRITSSYISPMGLAYNDLDASYKTTDLPALKNQNPWGTCWAISSVSIGEINLAKKGRVSADAIDLSPLQLAYFTYMIPSTVSDPLGGTAGDVNTGHFTFTSDKRNSGLFDIGGHLYLASNALASWVGLSNNEAPLKFTNTVNVLTGTDDSAKLNRGETTLNNNLAYTGNARLVGYYMCDYDINDLTPVKNLVRTYGAAGISINYTNTYVKKDTENTAGRTYTNFYYNYEGEYSNHAVTIVGWDDNIDKSLFTIDGHTPAGNGGWLIRNSWTTEDKDSVSAYFWLSYYDYSLTRPSISNAEDKDVPAISFSFEPASIADNNHQYDGSYWSGRSNIYYAANMFTAKSDTKELLKYVSFATNDTNAPFEIEVYTDISDPTDPASGTKVSAVTGTTTYSGYNTVELNDPIVIDEGETFAVAVKMTRKETGDHGLSIEAIVECKDANDFVWFDSTVSTSQGQSFYNTGSSWRDYDTYLANHNFTPSAEEGERPLKGYYGNFRIKALTSDYTTGQYTVMFNANGEDVSLSETQKTVNAGSAYGELPTPTRENYIFKGWNTNADGTGTTITSASICNDSITLYAIWEAGTIAELISGEEFNIALKNLVSESVITSANTTDSNIKSIIFTSTPFNTNTDPAAVKISTDDSIVSIYARKALDGDNNIIIEIYTPATTVNLNPSCENMFYGFETVTQIPFIEDLKINTSNVTDMYEMFYDCDALESLDLSNFDVSKVTAMGYMFDYCYSLAIIDMFDTSKASCDLPSVPTYFDEDDNNYWYLLDDNKNGFGDYSEYADATSWPAFIKDEVSGTCHRYIAVYEVHFENDENSSTDLSDEIKIFNAPSNIHEFYEFPGIGTENAKAVAPSVTPQKDGHRFLYWAKGGIQYDFDTPLSEPYITLTSVFEETAAPTMSVTFDTQTTDVTLTGSKTVTQGSPYGTLPNITRPGYQFLGWFDEATGGNKIESTTTVTKSTDHILYAHYTPNTNTTYTVNHYKQKIGKSNDTSNSDNWELAYTDNLTGTTGTTVTPATRTYTGFTAPTAVEITILGSGNTTLNYYYGRNKYSLAIVKGTGISSVSGATSTATLYEYGTSITIDATVNSGYTWNSWTEDEAVFSTTKNYTFTMPDRALVLTANANAPGSVSYKVRYWWEKVNAASTSTYPENESNYELHEEVPGTGTPGTQITPQVISYNGFFSPAWKTATIEADGSTVIDYYYTRKSYQIKFLNETGNEISMAYIKYGRPITSPGPAYETKAADNIYTYSFIGWKSTVDNSFLTSGTTACTRDDSYQAMFSNTYIDYTVRFLKEDGSQISSETYHYGDSIVVPTAPVKPGTDGKTYTFAGWSPSLNMTCIGNATYTATYSETTSTYTVIFKDYDGRIISENTYSHGQAISIPTSPIRNPSETYTYTFNSWTPNVSMTCTGNATYTATYSQSYINYTVSFVDYDGTPISSQNYHYGDTILIPDGPTRESDNTYSYEFLSWSPAIVSTCTGTVTYTATYTENYIPYTITFKDYDGRIISENTYHYSEIVTVPSDPTRTSLNGKDYVFTGWTPSTSAICLGSAEYTATYATTDTSYTVTFKNPDGSIISSAQYYYGDQVSVPTPNRTPDLYYEYTFTGWDKSVDLICYNNAEYTAQYTSTPIYYTVTFTDDEDRVISTDTYVYGEVLSIPAAPTKTADLMYTYTFKEWEGLVVNTCTGDATYKAKYTRELKKYTVLFKNIDGSTISRVSYGYGSIVNLPDDPTYTDASFDYTFTGWTPSVSTICEADAVYTATYTKTGKQFTVRFLNGNGSEMLKTTYRYGDTVMPPSTVPVKSEDAYGTYVFKEWSPAVTTCTKNMTYTPVFTTNYKSYIVNFYDYKKNLISTTTYHYQDSVSVPSAAAVDGYTFSGWTESSQASNASYTSKNIPKVTKDVSYYAVYVKNPSPTPKPTEEKKENTPTPSNNNTNNNVQNNQSSQQSSPAPTQNNSTISKQQQVEAKQEAKKAAVESRKEEQRKKSEENKKESQAEEQEQKNKSETEVKSAGSGKPVTDNISFGIALGKVSDEREYKDNARGGYVANAKELMAQYGKETDKDAKAKKDGKTVSLKISVQENKDITIPPAAAENYDIANVFKISFDKYHDDEKVSSYDDALIDITLPFSQYKDEGYMIYKVDFRLKDIIPIANNSKNAKLYSFTATNLESPYIIMKAKETPKEETVQEHQENISEAGEEVVTDESGVPQFPELEEEVEEPERTLKDVIMDNIPVVVIIGVVIFAIIMIIITVRIIRKRR